MTTYAATIGPWLTEIFAAALAAWAAAARALVEPGDEAGATDAVAAEAETTLAVMAGLVADAARLADRAEILGAETRALAAVAG
jgi:hypothetical protein